MGGHFVFWKEGFGPLRVNHCFAFVDAAKIDKDNGPYYQIDNKVRFFRLVMSFPLWSPRSVPHRQKKAIAQMKESSS